MLLHVAAERVRGLAVDAFREAANALRVERLGGGEERVGDDAALVAVPLRELQELAVLDANHAVRAVGEPLARIALRARTRGAGEPSRSRRRELGLSSASIACMSALSV